MQSVVVCQRAAKRFLETRNCRVQVLVKQWEKTESIWWHTRTSADSAKKLLNYSLAEDSAKQPIAAKPKFDVILPLITTSICAI